LPTREKLEIEFAIADCFQQCLARRQVSSCLLMREEHARQHCDTAPTPSGFAEIVSDDGFWLFWSPHYNAKKRREN
jgi:hypothetical protein